MSTKYLQEYANEKLLAGVVAGVSVLSAGLFAALVGTSIASAIMRIK